MNSENLKKKLIAWPKARTNQYLKILYENIEKGLPFEVLDFRGHLSLFFTQKVDVFHLHWLNGLIFKSIPKTLIKCFLFTLFLLFLKIKGVKFIWTVHNINPFTHSNFHPTIEAILVRILFFFSDKLIIHSKFQYDSLHINNKEKIFYIPHHSYKPIHQDYKPEVCIKNNYLYFGEIAKYKGVDNLIKLATEFPPEIENFHVSIIGRCTEEYYQNLVDKIVKFSAQSRINIENRFIKNSELEEVCLDTQGIILPYENITNSGTLIHALTLGKRVFIKKCKLSEEIVNEFPTLKHVVIGYDSIEELSVLIKCYADRPYSITQIHAFLDEVDCSNLIKKYYSQIIK